MSSDYYFEIRRKSYEFEENFTQPLRGNTETNLNTETVDNPAETLLTDYEIVSNEEVEEEEEAANTVSKISNLTNSTNFPVNYPNNAKLHLSLSAEKIALKSQTTKINKSIVQEAEKSRNISFRNSKQIADKGKTTATTTAIKRNQHVPIAFSIVPISLGHKYDSNDHDGNNFPEIVLTSFETRAGAKAKQQPQLPRKKSSTVTFRAATNLSNCNVIQQHNTHSIPKLSPPPEVVKSNFHIENLKNLPANVTVHSAEVYDRLRDSEDNSEINSQPGSSTSPESLMDNVLSAASSISVRSSSLSSGGTDMGAKGGSRGGAAVNVSEARIGEPHALVAKAVTKAVAVNRLLNSKPPELKVLLPPASPLNVSQTLQPPESFETNSNRSRSPSPTPSISIRITPDPMTFPEELKCSICTEVFRDPRTLNCLHSYCFQCIVDENFKQDSSIPFWSQPSGAEENEWKASNKSNYSTRSSSPEMSLRSGSDPAISPSRQRRSSFSFKRKKSLERILLKPKSDGKGSESSSSARLNHYSDEKPRIIMCRICNFVTELPLGGIRQLPQNFVLVRKIEEFKLKAGDEIISRVWCSLCFEEISAMYHCITCTLNLCGLCKEAHERQRNTANHQMKNIMELRRSRKVKPQTLVDNARFALKCGMHPGFEMKSFCSTCLQIACADCLVLLHKGHRHEPTSRAISNYSRILRDSADQTRPLCNYAEHSIERLNEIAKNINSKCDDIQAEVETFMSQYFEAVEVHRKTLLQQVNRAREAKVEMILEQQLDLEKRTNEAMEAITFSQELADIASDAETLSFVNILLKRFEYCQQFKMPVDPKISDSLHFLPKIRAPSTKTQNDIPLFGIITMQVVDPSLCTLQCDSVSHLRLHKRAELMLLSRDADGISLCHGGLQISALLKYKEYNTKFLPIEISDHRDGSYGISFTPDSQGTILLTVSINEKPIKGSPFTFIARTVRPHSGIFHCCAFCSSKGSKLVKCSCDGRMPGYNGCGHGHVGHPGRRHWSCCGNVLENSECNVANKLLNA